MRIISMKPVNITSPATIEFSGRELEVLRGVLGHLDYVVFKDVEVNGISAKINNVRADEASRICEMLFDVIDDHMEK